MKGRDLGGGKKSHVKKSSPLFMNILNQIFLNKLNKQNLNILRTENPMSKLLLGEGRVLTENKRTNRMVDNRKNL